MQVKVTRNYQITIPADIRRELGIKEGDVLVVRQVGDSIVLQKPRVDLPSFRLGREVTTEDVEKAVEEALTGG